MIKLNLNELTINNFQQWPNSFKYFIFAILGLAASIIYYVLGFRPGYYYYKSLINDEIRLKSEFEKKHILANLDAYKEQLSSLKKIYENRLKQLIKENELSVLLNEISQMAISSGLVFEFFAPKADESTEFPRKLILTMIVIGQYKNIAAFLNEISTIKKLITFEEFVIDKKEIDNENKNIKIKSTNLLRMKIRLKFYKY